MHNETTARKYARLWGHMYKKQAVLMSTEKEKTKKILGEILLQACWQVLGGWVAVCGTGVPLAPCAHPNVIARRAGKIEP